MVYLSIVYCKLILAVINNFYVYDLSSTYTPLERAGITAQLKGIGVDYHYKINFFDFTARKIVLTPADGKIFSANEECVSAVASIIDVSECTTGTPPRSRDGSHGIFA